MMYRCTSCGNETRGNENRVQFGPQHAFHLGVANEGKFLALGMRLQRGKGNKNHRSKVRRPTARIPGAEH